MTRISKTLFEIYSTLLVVQLKKNTENTHTYPIFWTDKIEYVYYICCFSLGEH